MSWLLKKSEQNLLVAPSMMQRRVLGAIIRPKIALLSRRCLSAPTKAPPPQRQSILARAWDSYSNSLYHRPLTTKASVAAIIFFTSDSAAQYLTRDCDKDFSFNASRALSGSFFGIAATGYLHAWWALLEGAVGARLPVQQYRLANTLVKVVIDQGIGAPFYIYSYYVVTNFLQTMSDNNGPNAKSPQQELQETNAKASTMLWPTMLRHWRLWPLVHSFNFYFVPLHHRVLVQNLVLVGWSGCKCENLSFSVVPETRSHFSCIFPFNILEIDLSYLNDNGAKLLTRKEEIEVTAKEIEHTKDGTAEVSGKPAVISTQTK